VDSYGGWPAYRPVILHIIGTDAHGGCGPGIWSCGQVWVCEILIQTETVMIKLICVFVVAISPISIVSAQLSEREMGQFKDLVMDWVSYYERSESPYFKNYCDMLRGDLHSALKIKPGDISGDPFIQLAHRSLRDYADIEIIDYSGTSQHMPVYKLWNFARFDVDFIVKSEFRQRMNWLKAYYEEWPDNSNEPTDTSAMEVLVMLQRDSFFHYLNGDVFKINFDFMFKNEKKLREIKLKGPSSIRRRFGYESMKIFLGSLIRKRPSVFWEYIDAEIGEIEAIKERVLSGELDNAFIGEIEDRIRNLGKIALEYNMFDPVGMEIMEVKNAFYSHLLENPRMKELGE
jgi:hypothetical protein